MCINLSRLARLLGSLALLAGILPARAQTNAVELDAVVISAQQPVSLLVNGFPIYDSDPVPSGSVTTPVTSVVRK